MKSQGIISFTLSIFNKMNILQSKQIKLLENPIDFGTFEAIGYFSYEKAGIYNYSIEKECSPHRSVFYNIENVLKENGISDNKFVVLFRDKAHFGTTNFAIFFKDCHARIGSWKDVTGYAGRPLD